MNGWEIDSRHFCDASKIVGSQDWYSLKNMRSWCECTPEYCCNRCICYVGLKSVECAYHRHDPITNLEFGIRNKVCHSHALIASIIHRNYQWMDLILRTTKPDLGIEYDFFQTCNGIRFSSSHTGEGDIIASHKMDAFALAVGILRDPQICLALIQHGADVNTPRSFEKIDPAKRLIPSMFRGIGGMDGAATRNIIEWLETLRGRSYQRLIASRVKEARNGELSENVVQGHLFMIIRMLCSMGAITPLYLTRHTPWAFSGVLDLHEFCEVLPSYLRGYIYAAMQIHIKLPGYAGIQEYGQRWILISGERDKREIKYEKRSSAEIQHIRDMHTRWNGRMISIEDKICDIILGYEVRMVSVPSENTTIKDKILNTIRGSEFVKVHDKTDHDTSFSRYSCETKVAMVVPTKNNNKTKKTGSGVPMRKVKVTPDQAAEILEKQESDIIIDMETKETPTEELHWRTQIKTRLRQIDSDTSIGDELGLLSERLKLYDAEEEVVVTSMDTRKDAVFPFTVHAVVIPQIPNSVVKLSSVGAAAPKRSPGLGLRIPS